MTSSLAEQTKLMAPQDPDPALKTLVLNYNQKEVVIFEHRSHNPISNHLNYNQKEVVIFEHRSHNQYLLLLTHHDLQPGLHMEHLNQLGRHQ
ncbi:hypothetical protein HanXRQr2_Chr11g0480471 [Helianthus annuus]|uniref:Uncharacterized protein n=1 Tax=Helianthus annuus TaxID=4232 RepID=A0A9K3MZP8_HELAN|nr:hypothetical protein HanXRQr2_Chr11g0480471 [Helianthus annuus]